MEESVYPRWRGEHFSDVDLVHLSSGLSPLARGTLHADHTPEPYARFIPAGAGNTAVGLFVSVLMPVYPRWRGEH